MPARIVRPTLLIVLGLTLAAAAWQIVAARPRPRRPIRGRRRHGATRSPAAARRCSTCAPSSAPTPRPARTSGIWRDRAADDLEALVACTGTLEATATAAAAPPRHPGRPRQAPRRRHRDAAARRPHGRPRRHRPARPRPRSALRRRHQHQRRARARAGRRRSRRSPAMDLGIRGRRPAAAGDRGARRLRRRAARRHGAGADAAGPRRDAAPANDQRRAGPHHRARTPRTRPSAPRFGERAASPAALQAAADVCGALARVQQPLELAGLVERMHGVLDSRGTIVWIYDEGNDVLRPGLSAGYPSTAIGRMGTIPLSSDTPVATAFTRGEARSVRGTDGGPGALVVPIVTAGGGVGGGDDRAAAGQRSAAGDAGADADLRRAAGRPARRWIRARPTSVGRNRDGRGPGRASAATRASAPPAALRI